MKRVVTVFLLAFVVASVVYLAVGDRREGDDAAPQAEVVQTPIAATVAPKTSHRAGNHELAGRVEGGPDVSNALRAEHAFAQESAEVPRVVIAYYFHRTQRCSTCLTMEAYAQDALREGLPNVVESGKLEWRAVNVDEPKYEHFVTEFDLYASALVIVEMAGDDVRRSKKLERIWDLIGDESEFKAYVRKEAIAYLKEAP